jgi:hypothetical protein
MKKKTFEMSTNSGKKSYMNHVVYAHANLNMEKNDIFYDLYKKTGLGSVRNLGFYKTKVYQYQSISLPSEAILQFSSFSVLEKRGPGLFLQYFKNTTVLVNTSVLKLHYLLHPNTLKYLIL